MKWWWKRGKAQLKITAQELWHVFEVKTPTTITEINKYEYISASTKVADEDETYELEKFKGRKK